MGVIAPGRARSYVVSHTAPFQICILDLDEAPRGGITGFGANLCGQPLLILLLAQGIETGLATFQQNLIYKNRQGS